ncbi:hypothetical protein CK203_094569 [Vitis vinifera]|uniref:Uncharacterized protein n=1 Tax=Vitis vinifera TaxID=29760 RepID=A0A438CJL6_VITVI|nr:hypothetical protein CK203_094569 [Vitis vinifera]
MILPHPHHHHHLDLPYSWTTTVPPPLPSPVVDDTQAHIERIEQRMRSLHVTDGVMSWDGMMTCLLPALPVEFCMSDIERYTGICMSDIERYMGIGCPRIHL